MQGNHTEEILSGLFLQEHIERGLRIAFDNQAFLGWCTCTMVQYLASSWMLVKSGTKVDWSPHIHDWR